MTEKPRPIRNAPLADPIVPASWQSYVLAQSLTPDACLWLRLHSLHNILRQCSMNRAEGVIEADPDHKGVNVSFQCGKQRLLPFTQSRRDTASALSIALIKRPSMMEESQRAALYTPAARALSPLAKLPFDGIQ